MRQRLPWIVGAAVALVFAAIFRDCAFGGRLPLDSVETNDVSFVGTVYEQWADRVRSGSAPLWFPEFDGGLPLAATWMYGVLSPGLALFLVLPLGAAWVWTAAIHAGIGAAGMTAFLRRRGAGDAGAIAGAVLFAVSEHFVGRTACGHLNLVMPLAWVPWVLAAADACVRGERRAVPWLALVSAAGLLSGHVQMWTYLVPLVAAFAATEAWASPDRAGAFRRLAAGAALAAGLAAVQISITAEFLAQAAPIGEDPSIVRQVSVPPVVLPMKLVASFAGPAPEGDALDFRHEFRGIAGLWAWGLAAWAFARNAPRRGLWAGFAVFGFLAAMGTRTPLTAWIQDVPPFSVSRSPGRFLVLPLVCIPVLAGHAPVRAVHTAAVCVLSVFAGIPGVRSVSDALHRVAWAERLPTEFTAHRIHPIDLYQITNFERSGLAGFRALCYVRTRGWHEVMAEPSAKIAWWVDLGAELDPVVRPGAPTVPSVDDILRTEIRPYDAMGRVRFFGDAAFGVSDDEALRRMRAGERTLFLDGPAPPPGPRGSGGARLVSSAPHRVEIETASSAPGWVLVSMKRFPGWRAEVDGSSAPVVRGSLAFPVVAVPAGRHTVVLAYAPWSFRIGLAISLASLAAVVLIFRRAGR